jgi:hypothetical protein
VAVAVEEDLPYPEALGEEALGDVAVGSKLFKVLKI